MILQLLYYFLPAYVANMAPVFIKHLPVKKFPIDCGVTLKGKPLFGNHKTWNGLLGGIAAGILTAGLQRLLAPTSLDLILYDNWALAGLLLSSGALLGDLAKSFFKRRIGISSGKPWIPFDQIDYSVGALLLGSILYFPGWTEAIVLVIASFMLHILVTKIGYFAGLRKEKW